MDAFDLVADASTGALMFFLSLIIGIPVFIITFVLWWLLKSSQEGKKK